MLQITWSLDKVSYLFLSLNDDDDVFICLKLLQKKNRICNPFPRLFFRKKNIFDFYGIDFNQVHTRCIQISGNLYTAITYESFICCLQKKEGKLLLLLLRLFSYSIFFCNPVIFLEAGSIFFLFFFVQSQILDLRILLIDSTSLH